MGLAVLVGALLLALVMARRFIAPVSALTGATGRIAVGDFDVPLAPTGPRELQSLARSFDQMRQGLKEHVEALGRSELKYRQLHQSMRDAFIIVDMDGRITDFNDALQAMLGYAPEEISALTYQDITPEKWHAFEEGIIRDQIITKGFSDIYEKEYRRKDVPVELRAFLLTDDAGKPENMWSVVRDITDRKRAEETLQKSLAEKEALLREVHHRVKNNLASILALMRMQRRDTTDPSTIAALTDLGGRIESMALIHEQLYRSGNMSRIGFQEYLETLVSHLRLSLGAPASLVSTVEAHGVSLDIDLAVPCGMMVNELVTNAIKHAFPGNAPRDGAAACEVSVSMEWDGSAYTLRVADNGVGIPEELDVRETHTMGMLLISMLGEHQLGGRLSVDRTGGTRFVLTFSPARTG
jgi:PAS domain S-box-containing protein